MPEGFGQRLKPSTRILEQMKKGVPIISAVIVVMFLSTMFTGCLGTGEVNLESPSDREEVDDIAPLFKWDEVAFADKYRIQVDDDQDFSTPMIDLTTDINIYYSYDAIPVGEECFWRVKAEVLGSWGKWSDTWSFTVSDDATASLLEREYEWRYDRQDWTVTFSIPRNEYYYYQNQDRTYDWAAYVTEDNDLMVDLAQDFKDLADQKGYDDHELVSFVLSFVQSLPYTVDSVTSGADEYPRYPVETLVDRGGDCEDTSFLLASILEAEPINIDCVLFLLPADYPEHMAVGVAGSGISGNYVLHDGVRYYYCETTGSGWQIGDVPSDYLGVQVDIVEV
jgi:hypothetical protein